MDQHPCFYPGCAQIVTTTYHNGAQTIRHGRSVSPALIDATAWMDEIHAPPTSLRDDWREHAEMVAAGG